VIFVVVSNVSRNYGDSLTIAVKILRARKVVAIREERWYVREYHRVGVMLPEAQNMKFLLTKTIRRIKKNLKIRKF
jgi:hypothetical protein